MSRRQIVQLWFGLVSTAAAVAVTFGDAMSTRTVLSMLALSLVPLAGALLLWPTVASPAASKIVRRR